MSASHLTISKDDVFNAYDKYVAGTHYAEDEGLLRKLFADERLQKNTDVCIAALKLGLIDTLYSTNLNKGIATTTVTTIASIITDPVYKFDDRMLRGDIQLVQDITNDSRMKRNNFSLMTKYCKLHEHFISESDNFVIFDSVVALNLFHYLPEYKGIKLSKYTPYRKCFDVRNYILWCDMINQVIYDNDLQDVENIRRKIDWYIWGKHNG
jgi:hypothetical protein